MEPIVIVHGGACTVSLHLQAATVTGVKQSAMAGMQAILEGGSALDAVEAAIRVMEDLECFDSGTGSVLNADGDIEMDSMIMDGSTLNAGSVACVKRIRNPVSLARLVMERTEHAMLVGEGADRFAAEQGVRQVPTEELVTQEARDQFKSMSGFTNTVESAFQLEEMHDTVGAVAMDRDGNIAAATSTGGITMKRPGRVGDSPIIGSGGYADNELGGVSMTGHGESILKCSLGHSILRSLDTPTKRMRDLAVPHGVQLATCFELHRMKARMMGRGGGGGAICLSPSGEPGLYHTTHHMPWAVCRRDTDQVTAGLNKDDNCDWALPSDLRGVVESAFQFPKT